MKTQVNIQVVEVCDGREPETRTGGMLLEHDVPLTEGQVGNLVAKLLREGERTIRIHKREADPEGKY